MLIQRAAENVAAVTPGDKIQVIRVGREKRRPEALLTGITDRAGGQAGMQVSVVWRLNLQIAVIQSRLVFAQDEQHGGAAFQRTAEFQAVEEDGGDERALPVVEGLLLDDRGEDQALMETSDRRSRCPALQQAGPDLFETFCHQSQDFRFRNIGRNEISFREKVSPQAGRIETQRAGHGIAA